MIHNLLLIVLLISLSLALIAGIFTEYLMKLDRKFERENRKILLFMDNCASHSPEIQSKLKNIKLEFFPAQTTSALQPMDQGAFSDIEIM